MDGFPANLRKKEICGIVIIPIGTYQDRPTGKERLPVKRIFAILLLVSLLFVVPAAHADLMSDARGMLQLVNDFRTGDNAWYWNRDNTTYTLKTNLGALQYDEELEATALVRANEIAQVFDHTRPDGSDCTTAFPAGRVYMAENIAYGYRTAEDAFEAWLEEEDDYAGQGHRRNMLLGSVTRIGIAAVEIGGVRYWVQEFSSDPVDNAVGGGATGWFEENGKWYYRKADGNLVVGWLKEKNKWYLLDGSGAMQTGWQEVNGTWYYFGDNGVLRTGWQEVSGKWYLFGSSGEMKTGWQKDGGKWYYLNGSGVLQTDQWIKDGGKTYYANSSGEMQTGWKEIGGSWYYFASSGVMQTGWKQLKNTWYYFRSTGEMVTGTVTIDGQKEVFNASGAWLYSEIQDYDTPLAVQPLAVRLFRAFLQQLMQLLRIR